MIHSQRDSLSNLTTHTIEGSVTTEDILKVVEAFYTSAPTLLVLWDFRLADATDISSDDIKRLVGDVRQYAHLREGGKTSFVLPRDLGFGQGRIFGRVWAPCG